MSVTVKGTAQVNANLHKYVEALRKNAQTAMEEIAALLQEYAKANHPWQNDTGDTERTTQAVITEITSALITVTLTTGTDYSKFLELARSGQYAWLWPTLLACEADILRILTARLGSRAAGFSLKPGSHQPMSSALNLALYARLTGMEVLTGDFLACQQALAERLGTDPKKQKPAARYGSLGDYAVFPCVTFYPSGGLTDRRFSVDTAVDDGIYNLEVWGKSREANEVSDIAALVDRLLLSNLGAPPLPLATGRIHLVQTLVKFNIVPDTKRNAWCGLTRYKFVERLR